MLFETVSTLAYWILFHAVLSSADSFHNQVRQKYFENTIDIGGSNSSDLDKAGSFVGPDYFILQPDGLILVYTVCSSLSVQIYEVFTIEYSLYQSLFHSEWAKLHRD